MIPLTVSPTKKTLSWVRGEFHGDARVTCEESGKPRPEDQVDSVIGANDADMTRRPIPQFLDRIDLRSDTFEVVCNPLDKTFPCGCRSHVTRRPRKKTHAEQLLQRPDRVTEGRARYP